MMNSQESQNTELILVNQQNTKCVFKDIHDKENKSCRITPIYKLPQISSRYFLFGDTIISLSQSNNLNFEDALAVSNSYRPVVNVQRDFHSNFMKINLDCSTVGLKDFQFIIHMMQSMQDQEIYNLSQVLQEYQILVNNDQKQQIMSDPMEIQKNKMLLQQYQNTLIPQFLKSECIENPHALQFYFMIDSTNSFVDARMSEYGINQNFLNLLGSDLQQMQEFVMRVGWFEATWFLDNYLIRQFLQQYIDFVKLKKGYNFTQNFSFRILTLDQILLPATFATKVYYLLNDENVKYTTDITQYSLEQMIGVFVVADIDVDIRNIKNLINIRKSKQTLQKNNLLTQLSESTLSFFQYSTQSDYFYHQFYKQSNEQNQKEKFLQDVYPEKTCNYKMI